MSAHPIYDAVLTDQGFDPFAVPPIQTEAERGALHVAWLVAAVDRVKAADASMWGRKPRARKVAAK